MHSDGNYLKRTLKTVCKSSLYLYLWTWSVFHHCVSGYNDVWQCEWCGQVDTAAGGLTGTGSSSHQDQDLRGGVPAAADNTGNWSWWFSTANTSELHKITTEDIGLDRAFNSKEITNQTISLLHHSLKAPQGYLIPWHVESDAMFVSVDASTFPADEDQFWAQCPCQQLHWWWSSDWQSLHSHWNNPMLYYLRVIYNHQIK